MQPQIAIIFLLHAFAPFNEPDKDQTDFEKLYDVFTLCVWRY